MTCIVGVIENGIGYLASDECGSDGYHKHPFDNNKIFRNGNFIIGYTSSYRMGQLLQYSLDIPKQSKKISDDNYIYKIFINSVRTLLKENGYSKISNNLEEIGTFMFVYKHKLYKMQNDLSVTIDKHGFDACGSGEDYARATMYNLRDSDMSVEEKLINSVKTAEEFVCTVDGMVHIISEND